MIPDHPTIALDPIPGHPGYLSCRLGIIFSLKQGKGPIPLAGHISKNGYLVIKEVQHPKQYNVHVHYLILKTYVGPRPPGMEALHGPGGKLDNRPENLRWGTHKENSNDWDSFHVNQVRGSRHGRAILTDDDIPIIRDMRPCDAARRFGISEDQASRIKRRERWGHIP